MTQADRVHSTPPTNTSALPVGPTRRRLLTVAVGGAALAIATTAAHATGSPRAVPPAGRAFTAAARDMAAAHVRLNTARAGVDQAMEAVKAWEAANPMPSGKRKLKRWRRQQGALRYSPAVTAAWEAQIEAENAYREAQVAVATIPATARADVVAKAALAVVYDGERLSSGPAGLISIALAYDVVRLDQAVQS